MDRIGADFHHTIAMIENRLRATALPIQVPMGSENLFRGIIDLVENKAISFPDDPDTMPAEEAIPESEKAIVAKQRQALIEKLAENDDQIMAMYVDGQEVSPFILKAAIRRLTVSNYLVPILCGKYELIFNRTENFVVLRIAEMPLHQFIIYVLGAVIVTPVIEESLYRGFMYSPFSRKIGHKGSVFLTSLIWSMKHQDVRSIGSLIILGIILCYLYVKTESLISGMIMHSATSFTCLMIFVYLRLFEKGVLRLESNSFVMLAALFFFSGFIILSVISRKMNRAVASGRLRGS